MGNLRTRVAVLAVTLLLAGCADPGAGLLAQRAGFNATLIGIHAARVAGLPASDEAKTVPYLVATKASLDAGDAAYIAGDKDTASVYLKAANAGLVKLAQILPATRPTTKPSK